MYSRESDSFLRECFSAIHEFWRTVIMTAYEMWMHPEHRKKPGAQKESKE